MIFRILAKNVANITKAAFYLFQTNILPKKCFREKEFNTWGFSGKKSQNFGGKMSRRIFWGNKFCKKCNSNIYWLWERKFQTFPKSSQQSCQHGILRLQRINSRNKRKYTVPWFSRTPRKPFWTLCEEFFAGLSIMHFTRQKGVLVEFSVWNLRFAFTDFKR